MEGHKQPDSDTCTVDLTAQDWDSLNTSGMPSTGFEELRTSTDRLLAVNFLDPSGATLGVAADDTCDPWA